MDTTTNIFLIGPMGAGKSTIGKRLARTLNKTFIDSDQQIESRTGVDIPTIFDIEGEAGFRKREAAMIDELSQSTNLVLATGGGAILSEENRQHLMSRGVVIYLQTSIAQQLARTRHDRNRPLLNTDDPESKLTELMNLRAPLYREIADIVVDTDNRHSNQVCKEIQKNLTAYLGKSL
jgi:shikimate kinase